jgi:hypothetical protein
MDGKTTDQACACQAKKHLRSDYLSVIQTNILACCVWLLMVCRKKSSPLDKEKAKKKSPSAKADGL